MKHGIERFVVTWRAAVTGRLPPARRQQRSDHGLSASAQISGVLVRARSRSGHVHVVDLVSGQVDLMFNNVVVSATYVKNGKVRGLGVSTEKPSPALPDIPPVASVFPGFDIPSWMGIYAPAGTPKE